MNMRDLIDLVKSGLKPSEIKEMIELEKEVKDIVIEPEVTESKPEESKKDESTESQDGKKDESNTGVDSDELKKAKDEIESLKRQIASIQSENKNKDLSGNQSKSLDEQIVDIFNQML